MESQDSLADSSTSMWILRVEVIPELLVPREKPARQDPAAPGRPAQSVAPVPRVPREQQEPRVRPVRPDLGRQAPQVPKERLVLRELQVLRELAQRVPPASVVQARLARREEPVPREIRGLLVLLVRRVSMALKDRVVSRVVQDRRGNRAPQVPQVLRERLARPVLKALLASTAFRAQPDSLAPRETPESSVLPATLALRVSMDLRERRAIEVPLALRELRGRQVRQVQQDSMVSMGLQVTQARRELAQRAPLAHKARQVQEAVTPVPQEFRVLMVLRDRVEPLVRRAPARLVPPALLVIPVSTALREVWALPEPQELRAAQVQPEIRALQGLLDLRATTARMVFLALRALLARLDHRERQAIPESKEPLDQLALLETTVSTVFQALPEQRERRGHKVNRGLRDLQVQLVMTEWMGCLVAQARRVLLVRLVFKGRRGQPGLREQRGQQEPKAPQVQQACKA